MTQILLLKDDLVKQLSALKDDNVSIADVIIKRKPLLEALKLQNQEGSDVLTVSYGKVSGYTDKPEMCVQISCNHTVMRFLNRPKAPKWRELDTTKVKSFNFGAYREKALNGIQLKPQDLLTAINFVSSSIACEETRPAIHCLYLECENDRILFAGADGFRLSTYTLSAKGIPQGKLLIELSDVFKITTFLKSVKPIGKGRAKIQPGVYLTYGDKSLKLTTTNNDIEVVIHKLTYPDFTKLIPQAGTKIEFIANDLLQYVKALRVMARDGSGIVRLEFSKGEPCGKITLSSKSEDTGQSITTCDAIVESDGRIAFNSTYLIDFLNQCKDSRITALYTNQSSPVLFTLNDNKQFLLMPMQVQWDDDKQEIKN